MAAPIHESITSLDGLTFESAPSEPTSTSSRVKESFAVDLGTILGPAWGMFGGDGDMAGRYGGWWPPDRVALPNNAPSPGIFSEIQYRAIVSWSRFLCERNMFAIGFRDRLRDFVGPVTVQFVRRGQNPGTQDEDGNGVPDDPLVAQVQQFWDEWCESADWGHGEEDRERECRERLCEDGEVTLRLGPTKDGLPWVRFIEPEQIRRPAWKVETEGDWEWGVCTDPDDAEGEPLALAVCDPRSGGGSGEEVKQGEFVRMKGNVKRSQKRGLPDFFPVEQSLQVVLGLLSNLGTTGKAQSAIAWIQKYATATPDQVMSMIRQGADAYAQYNSPGGPQQGTTLSSNGGPILPVKDNPAGTVIHADQNRQYEAGPVSTGVPSFMQIVDSTLKATGFRFGIPDWFTSGDGQSFAAALVTGSPFVRSIQDRQNKMIGFTKALAIRVIELGEKAGRLPVGTSEKVRPIATAQPVVIADDEKQARTFLALFDKNVADPIDWIKKRGGDPKVVAANIQSWREKFADQQQPVPQTATGGAGGKGKDPTPAPPGSAGGDGSSPNNPDDGGLGDALARAGENVTEGSGPHKFSSTHVLLTGDAAFEVLALARTIRPEDLGEDGKEDEPHVTILYGLHTEDPADVLPILRVSGPINMRLGAVSVFAGSDTGKPYDVLKVDVESDDLHRLHEALLTLPNSQSLPDYKPHATIGYVKAGLGQDYAARMRPVNLGTAADRVVFSNRENEQFVIPLRGGVRESAPGLMDKEITVHRGDKTFTQHRKVRASESAPPPILARAGEKDQTDAKVAKSISESIAQAFPEDVQKPGVLAKVQALSAKVSEKLHAFLIDHATAITKLGTAINFASAFFTTPGDMHKYPWLMGVYGANSQKTGDSLSSSMNDMAGVGIPGHLASQLVATALVKAWAGVKHLAGSKTTESDQIDAVAQLIAGLVDVIRESIGLSAGADAGAIAEQLRAHAKPE